MIALAKLIVKITIYLITTLLSAQTMVGSWGGTLEVQGTEIPLVFNITEKENKYITTLDSPSQRAMRLPTKMTTISGEDVIIDASGIGIVFTGKYKNEKIVGTFRQNGLELPLTLEKKEGNIKKNNRPQEPKKPYPYKEEEVFFENTQANGIKLAGTLTLPNDRKNPPVVILISGSGPQNRNEELLGHKPFLVLADHLTRKGIAVLRFDDRGTAKSEGEFKGATSLDFATDVEAAITYLKTRNKDIDVSKIGLMGHSEGGLIGPIVASRNKDVAYMVMLAGLGVSGDKVLLKQARRSLELSGVTESDISYNENYSKKIYELTKSLKGEVLEEKVAAILKEMQKNAPKAIQEQLTDDAIKRQIKMISNTWMLGLLNYQPIEYLSKINCPVLAINGEKDFQVDAKMNLNGIREGLQIAKNNDVTIKELKDLNHLFQTSKTGAFSEYATIEETFSPKALLLISEWINKRF